MKQHTITWLDRLWRVTDWRDLLASLPSAYGSAQVVFELEAVEGPVFRLRTFEGQEPTDEIARLVDEAAQAERQEGEAE